MEGNLLLPKRKTLRGRLGTKTDLGLNNVVAYLGLPSAAVDYFSEVLKGLIVVVKTNIVQLSMGHDQMHFTIS